jgi:hypothetical protein
MGYVAAFIVGAWFGIVIMSLAVAAGRGSDNDRRKEDRRDHHEDV